jgi:16S rRNA (cytidine1402-2'-O)-methyltransferase
MQDVVSTLGPERPVALARELTKRFEEVFRGRAADALAHLQASPPRGEFTLVIGGASAPAVGSDSA